ncbi:hypothetical protein CFI11_09465 [Thalassococcus sp. S3]|nr:hypothetical protein CFI11_09465 [Thalassococcus sp. S3]
MRRFQVLGERSSGTNFVKRLLGRNTELQPTEALGWKHGFPHMLAIPADLAVICVVRAPEAWALSMHAKPWHTTPEMQALPFSDFIRSPWNTIVDRGRYFSGAEAAGLVGQPLAHDRNPLTGEVFENLFALRTAKITAMLGYLNRGVPCIVARMERVQHDPEDFVAAVTDAVGGAQHHPFRPVVKRLGSKFRAAIPARPATPGALAPEDLAFLRNTLDLTLEHRLGYMR